MFTLILSGIPGFFVAKRVAGKKAGEKGLLPSLKIKIRRKENGVLYIHIHHYVISIFSIATLLTLHVQFMPVIGFLTGTALQGVFYKDFHKFLYWEKSQEA